MLAALHRLLRGQDELSFLRQLTTPLDLNFQPLSKQRQGAKDKRQTIKDDRYVNIITLSSQGVLLRSNLFSAVYAILLC